MTKVYERNPLAGPGVHVLAIGVGDYPHLIDGTQKLAKMPLGLGQLSSPPLSLKAFVTWCLASVMKAGATGLQNDQCSLATVEVLCSAKGAISVDVPGGAVELERATRANIKAAFTRWRMRVCSDDKNIGVFYFCGHGVMVADHYLLAEDFGDDDEAPWDKAFDVSNSLRAMERETKGALYFLVDACRQVSKKIALTAGAIPTSLMVVDLEKAVVRSSATLIRATGEGKLAFAPGGKVSRFTDVLLTALSGYCGIRTSGKPTWDVDGETLATAVRKLLENNNKSSQRKQVSDQQIGGTSVPLLRVTTAPMVKVEIDLLPTEKRAVAQMSLTSSKGVKFVHDGSKGVLLKDIPGGVYDVSAQAAAHEFADLSYPEEGVWPPVYELTMGPAV